MSSSDMSNTSESGVLISCTSEQLRLRDILQHNLNEDNTVSSESVHLLSDEKNSLRGEDIMDMQCEVNNEVDVCSRNDYGFLDILKEQELINKKTEVHHPKCDNSIMLNFDPLNNNLSQNCDSLQMVEAVDNLPGGSFSITPTSSDDNNTSCYNQIGHLISPLVSGEFINTAMSSALSSPFSSSSSLVITETNKVTSLPFSYPVTNTIVTKTVDTIAPALDNVQSFKEVLATATTCTTEFLNQSMDQPSVLLNKSFTTTTTYSPWRHHSVLNQALGGGSGGGGDSSPEWSSYSIPTTNRLQNSITIQQDQPHHDNEDDNFVNDEVVNYSSDVKQSFCPKEFQSTAGSDATDNPPNSVQKKAGNMDLDSLIGMFSRVAVEDDSIRESESTVNQAIRNSELTVSYCNTPEITHSKSVNPSLTYVLKSERHSHTTLVKTTQSIPSSSIPLLTYEPFHTPEHSCQNDVAMNSKENATQQIRYNTPECINIIDKTHCNTPNNNDHSGISGFLSKAASSIYARLISSGSSQKSIKIDSPFMMKQQNIFDSSKSPPIHQCPSIKKNTSINKESNIEHDILEKDEKYEETGQKEVEVGEQQYDELCLQPLTSPQSFERQSQYCLEEEETWKTVSSIHEVSCSMEISSGLDTNTEQIEDKENKQVLQVIHKEIGDISMQSYTDSFMSTSETRPILKELHSNHNISNNCNGSQYSFDNNRDLLSHELQDEKQETVSIKTTSFNTSDASHDVIEDVEQTTQDLRDQIHILRNRAEIWKSVLNDYRSTFLDSATIISESKRIDTEKLLHLVQERDESVDQAAQMHTVYTGMVRRIERAQSVVELARKKQDSLQENLNEISSDVSVMQEKITNLISVSEKKLQDALINQEI
ncbi:unnamed protein product [Heterobilharzia americana]|nr:unnamed protein product [Heterobilharzia americana]